MGRDSQGKCFWWECVQGEYPDLLSLWVAEWPATYDALYKRLLSDLLNFMHFSSVVWSLWSPDSCVSCLPPSRAIEKRVKMLPVDTFVENVVHSPNFRLSTGTRVRACRKCSKSSSVAICISWMYHCPPTKGTDISGTAFYGSTVWVKKVAPQKTFAVFSFLLNLCN